MPPTLSLIFDLAVAIEERNAGALAVARAQLAELLGSEEAVARLVTRFHAEVPARAGPQLAPRPLPISAA